MDLRVLLAEHYPDTEGQIRSLTRLMDQMLRNVPLFKLVNLGDDASTVLLRETLSALTGGIHDGV